MSKQHTLYNFFKKVPSPSTKTTTNDSDVKKENPEASDNTFITPRKIKNSCDADIEMCSLVWAKLEGYPWWPSLVCGHPKSGRYRKGNLIHVQFFDTPPTRAWINKRHIEVYNPNSDRKQPKVISSSELEMLTKACEQADKAYNMTTDKRADLLINFNDVSDLDDSKSNEEGSPGTDKENENANSLNPRKKRKVFVFDSEDSEDEYKPGKNEEDEEDDDDDESSGDDSNISDIMSEETELEEETPSKAVKRKRPNQKSRGTNKKISLCPTPSSGSGVSLSNNTVKAKLALFKNTGNATPKDSEQKTDDWPHLKLEFLQPDKIMDKNKRRPDHPDYNKRTLYVPESYKSKVTPGVRQWWELKSDNFDCVLFFKVGKFYELYHMDAVIGVNELSLTYMRGEFAHSGFPEIAYARFATILVQKGYKVARVEQTETPEMMTERCKTQSRTSRFDRVVSREICQITTKGTQIFSFIDGEAKESDTNYLLALTEKTDHTNSDIFGICFIDTSIGTFHIGQFTDDKYLSALRTLLSHYPPVQILYEKNHISTKTMQFLKTSFASVIQEALASETEFWSANKTLTTLSEEKYFLDESGSGIRWPHAIKKFINEADSLGLTPSDDGELALKAFGATIWYLKQCYLEQQILAMKKFEVYTPSLESAKILSGSGSSQVNLGSHLILDGIALTNLEVLVNSNGGKAGTLLDKMDNCCTFAGKRLLRQWLCSPLCNINAIKSRQGAVAELLEKSHILGEIRSIFKQIPDLERLLGKIHTQGNAIRSTTHPDSRAIFFEDKIYSKRKIQDFLSALTGFQKLQKAITIFQAAGPFSSGLLQKCTAYAPEGQFPNLTSQLKFFEDAFDHELAKKEGCIIPKSKGVDLEYDAAMDELKKLEIEMKEYINSQCQYFGVGVKYFGSDKNRFQIEIPESAAKKTGSDYEFTSSRKGYKRFMTPKTKEFLRRQVQAEENKSSVLKDLCRRVFEQFGEKHAEWSSAFQCMAVLDVLVSMAEYCRSEQGSMCFPEFSEPKSDIKPFINIKNGRHPCITVENGFIPNDARIGAEEFNSLILLTGPNMGGKSTLMRQIGLIVIMAHMGSQVPAESCDLTVVDRIFTRIGASDDLIAGESTLYLELSETSLILNHATKYSLALIDELGRGTSTYDGTAIAYSVVKELSDLQCRTLFSTHYHTLVEDFKTSDSVSLGHMACMVETDEDDPSEETVTFLYKFIKGACPKSHGFNAAKLAGVPSHIIKVGKEKADVLEKETESRKIFRKLFKINNSDSNELSNLLNSIKLEV